MAADRVPNTLRRLARRLFADDSECETFIQSLQTPAERPTAVVWTGDRPNDSPFDALPPAEWQPQHVDLVPFEQRPGRHAIHTSGDIYCLDPSSVFASQVLTGIPRAERIVDLCASPGGKAILAWRLLRPQRLLCNEVIGKRTGALISNLKRCRIAPAEVCSADSELLAEQMQGTADLVIVDAPCSGQSLIARGKPSPGCFHPATINMNSNRQRRILSNAVRLLTPGGYLAYMTCTYAIKENERNLTWLLKKNPELSPVEVPLLARWQSDYSEVPCYRLWPFDSEGAGGFTALLQRDEEAEHNKDWRPPRIVWNSESQDLN